MGRPMLVFRLAASGIRHRPVQAALLFVVIVATSTTLTLGLAVRHVAQSPFDHTRAVTKGPDIVIDGQPNPGERVRSAAFATLHHAPEVTGTAGPFPLAFVRLSGRGLDVRVNAEGRASVRAPVDQPLIAAGHWVRPGGVVLEQGLASTLGLHVGDRVSLGRRSFHVVGIALETEQAYYPAAEPGLVWVTPTDAARLATRSNPLGYIFDVKVAHPSAVQDFENGNLFRALNGAMQGTTAWQNWKVVQKEDGKVLTVNKTVLLLGSWLLAMLASASIAIVVAARMTEQTRRVGLLKAVGATPRFVSVVLLAENLLLALVGAGAGLLIGLLLAPSLTDPGAGLLGAPPADPLTVVGVAVVFLVSTGVALAATCVPAVRGARTSTLRALYDSVRPPSRHPQLIALSARMPVPLLLGLRLMSRRLRRTALTSANLAIAVAMVVVAILLQSQIDVAQPPSSRPGPFMDGSNLSALGGRLTHVVWILGAVLFALAALNAIFATWAAVIDAQRPTALARALGASPRQVSGGIVGAQVLPSLAAAVIGIPVGLALYQLAGGQVSRAHPSLPLLVGLVPAIVLAAAALTFVPARIGASRPVASVLRSE